MRLKDLPKIKQKCYYYICICLENQSFFMSHVRPKNYICQEKKYQNQYTVCPRSLYPNLFSNLLNSLGQNFLDREYPEYYLAA